MKFDGIIFDWAGTTVDYGCFAPVKAFIEAFEALRDYPHAGRSAQTYGNAEDRPCANHAFHGPNLAAWEEKCNRDTGRKRM